MTLNRKCILDFTMVNHLNQLSLLALNLLRCDLQPTITRENCQGRQKTHALGRCHRAVPRLRDAKSNDLWNNEKCSKKVTTHPDIAHPIGNPPLEFQLWKESLFLPVGKGFFGVCSSSVCWNNLKKKFQATESPKMLFWQLNILKKSVCQESELSNIGSKLLHNGLTSRHNSYLKLPNTYPKKKAAWRLRVKWFKIHWCRPSILEHPGFTKSLN